jgi:hypothetical protein
VTAAIARKIRIEYRGATYHVMARGNQGRDRNPGISSLFKDRKKTIWQNHNQK